MIRAVGVLAVGVLAGLVVFAGIAWVAVYFGKPTIFPHLEGNRPWH